ncbi:DUF308 domain-containing protein [Glutamicibacter sp. PS]|uniref:DUF308 domain-containing protein n=1 Tax=Glutamicibacter sp. PS TaxID=3075634 RepID=UPI002841285C|nr:DUF308 domain-containing protein [Glutamicibacter sp. PS]MDR4534382.1 DUF308 domain-containing protein [Glutamicibacter sp. PS]
MPADKTTPVQASEVFRPVFLRGLSALIYALASIFWINADTQVLAYATGALLVVTGVFMWQYASVPSAPEKSRGLYALGSGLMLVAGIVTLFMSTPAMVGFMAAFGFLVAGISEILIFAKYRGVFPPYRNQLVSGAVSVALAAALAVGGSLDAHGMFGLIGGGAIIFAVFVLIAAFGHRHESRKEQADPGTPESN